MGSALRPEGRPIKIKRPAAAGIFRLSYSLRMSGARRREPGRPRVETSRYFGSRQFGMSAPKGESATKEALPTSLAFKRSGGGAGVKDLACQTPIEKRTE